MSYSKQLTIGFDWDGTLVGCKAKQLAVLAKVWAESFQPAGLDLELFWQLKREGLNNLEALAKFQISEEMAQLLAMKWIHEIEQPQWLALDIVSYEGIAALQKWNAFGYSVIIITARSCSENVIAQISNSCLASLIADVAVVEPRMAADPKAEIIRSRRVMAYIGDTESDFSAAQRAGVLFAGVSCGQRSLNRLAQMGVKPVFPDPLHATQYLLPLVSHLHSA